MMQAKNHQSDENPHQRNCFEGIHDDSQGDGKVFRIVREVEVPPVVNVQPAVDKDEYQADHSQHIGHVGEPGQLLQLLHDAVGQQRNVNDGSVGVDAEILSGYQFHELERKNQKPSRYCARENK